MRTGGTGSRLAPPSAPAAHRFQRLRFRPQPAALRRTGRLQQAAHQQAAHRQAAHQQAAHQQVAHRRMVQLLQVVQLRRVAQLQQAARLRRVAHRRVGRLRRARSGSPFGV